MDVYGIGKVTGVFETFVPGVFLLINLALAVAYLPVQDDRVSAFWLLLKFNTAVGVVIAVAFGYLIGVLLRLLKARRPDLTSACLLRACRRLFRFEKKLPLRLREHFPYICRMKELCSESYGPDALDFHHVVWEPWARPKGNQGFFNFLKLIVASIDQQAAVEMARAESLCRYVSGMAYALVFSMLAILAAMAYQRAAEGIWVPGLVLLIVFYAFAAIGILANFRDLRLKEAATLFTFSFNNRKTLLRKLPSCKDSGRDRCPDPEGSRET